MDNVCLFVPDMGSHVEYKHEENWFDCSMNKKMLDAIREMGSSRLVNTIETDEGVLRTMSMRGW